MLESTIEKFCTKHAKKAGWAAYKASSPGLPGMLDHAYFLNGVCFFIEYKSTGKRPTPKQIKRAEELASAGIVCRCFNQIDAAVRFIDEITYTVTKVLEDCPKSGRVTLLELAESNSLSFLNPEKEI